MDLFLYVYNDDMCMEKKIHQIHVNVTGKLESKLGKL